MSKLSLYLSIAIFGIIFYNSGLFIFNDETLITGCFLIFCILIYLKGSALISTALDERREKLYNELNTAIQGRRALLLFSIAYYEQVGKLSVEIRKFIAELQIQLSNYAQSRSLLLQVTVTSLVLKKLQLLMVRERSFYNTIHTELGNLLYSRIKEKLILNKTKLSLITETINVLGSDKKRHVTQQLDNLLFNTGFFLKL